LLLPVIWLVAKRQHARTADSEREWHTQVSAFRRGGAGAGAPNAHKKGRARRSTKRSHSASCRTLGTLAHYKLHALQHMYMPCRSSFSLPSRRRLKMSRQVNFDAFCDHAAHGRLADVQRMLESGELLVDKNVNHALWRAAENGHVDVVDCLLRHAMFDPSADRNRAIRLAAEHGHLAVVERLLLDARVDPSANDNYAVACAAREGHLAVVERLLQDKRVDPSADDNYAIGLAAENGHLAVVERLLLDARVDPSASNNRAIWLAAMNGQLAVVERLLQDQRVDPSAEDNNAVRLAAQWGRLAVVERLLRDERVDPSADDNGALRQAACYGRLAVLERLLQDKRVDPSANDNYAVGRAEFYGCRAVVDRLLEDDRVDVAVAIRSSRPADRKRFECRERLTEICIALQDLELPAWVTVQILDAARPWSTLPLHSKWSLVCAVKHFQDKKQ
jgi:ankyrin repeat protein